MVRREIEGGGLPPNYSGINPEELKETIASLKRDHKQLQSRATYYKSQFERYGIDTSPITGLLKIAGWTDNQFPMLTRRYHLALNMETGYPGFKHMVQINENDVSKYAVELSKQSGKNLGKEFREAAENGKPASKELFQTLSAHSNDADYLQAFYKALGPERMFALTNEMVSPQYKDRYYDHSNEVEADRRILAKTFGSFTQVENEGKSGKEKQAYWDKWFDKFSTDLRPGFRSDRLIPILAGGIQDKDFLVALGDRIYKSGDKTTAETEALRTSGEQGPWGSDHYTQLFNAISKNSEASGEWMDHNYDEIQKELYPAGPWRLDEPKSRAEAFFRIAHKGTIELRATNEPLAEKLTSRIMFDNYQHTQSEATKGIHPIHGADYLYSEIISSYWKDMQHGITSPIGDQLWMGDPKTGDGFAEKGSKWSYTQFKNEQDPTRYGIEAGPAAWQAMLGEAARDPRGAGRLSALFDAYKKKLDMDVAHTERSSDEVVLLQKEQRGMMMHAYTNAFTSAEASIEGDAKEWADGVNSARAKIIETAAAGAKAASSSGATAVAEMGTSMAGDAATGLLTGWVGSLASVKPEEAPDGLASNYKRISNIQLDTSWQQTYREGANPYLAVDPSNPSGGFNEAIVPPVSYNRIGAKTHWFHGGTSQYIHGPDSNFLKPDGSVMELNDIKKHPQALTAYGNWLENKAVSTKVHRDGFSNGQMAKDF